MNADDRAELAIAMVDEGRLTDWDDSLVVLEVSRELYEQFKEQKLNDWKNYDNI